MSLSTLVRALRKTTQKTITGRKSGLSKDVKGLFSVR